jgi:hypothetical protein
MTPDERRLRLEELRRLAPDADTLQPDISKYFLPLQRHALALQQEILVVRGERGTGKTALFHVLTKQGTNDQLASFFPEARIQDASWIAGFSETGARHPHPAVLDEYAAQAKDEDLRLFWMAHLACCLSEAGYARDQLPKALWETWKDGINAPQDWVSVAKARLAEVTRYVDAVDRQLDDMVFVTYDHLDKIGLYQAEVRERYAGTLLALWLSLSNRYRFLRAKIFMREDLFAAAERAFADASKLTSRSISLDWHKESLFRLLLRHMAALSPQMKDWIESGGRGISMREHASWGFMPPDTLPETGRESQKGFVDHLAGETMGKGAKKGYTYRWIPNRLQDAHIRIVPRSLLNLIGTAADIALKQTPKARYDRLLHPSELHAALAETSSRRVKELAEEHKVVARLENLRGMTVMLDAAVVKRHLSRSPKAEDGFSADGGRVMDELIRLGVLKTRSDGRIDVPDIYRYGYDIKRKGGVAKPR